jgi:hypothetical protein
MSEYEPGGDAEIENDFFLARPIRENLGQVTEWVRQHTEFAPEIVRNISFEPQSIIEKGVSWVQKHKKAAAAVGGTALGGIGFVAGAVTATHRQV